MRPLHLDLDPRTSFLAKIYVGLLLCSFVSIFSVGFVSIYFFKSIVKEQILDNSAKTTEIVASKLEVILNYTEKANKEFLKSPKLSLLIESKDRDGLLRYFSDYKFSNINLFSGEGEMLLAFHRLGDRNMLSNSQLENLQPKLNRTSLESLESTSTSRNYYSENQSIELSSYLKILGSKGQTFVLETAISLNRDFFESMAKDLSINMHISAGTTKLVSIPSELGSFIGSENQDSSLVQFKGDWYSTDVRQVGDLSVFVLKNVDNLLGTADKIHWRVILISFFLFLVSVPILYFMALFLAKPVLFLLERLRLFRLRENQNLIPITSEDEFGSILQEINSIFSEHVHTQQEMQNKNLEIVVLNKKNESLRESYVFVLQDYLVARVFRRRVDNLLSQINYGQSIANNTKKFCTTVSDLVSFVSTTDSGIAYSRKHQIPSRIHELELSADHMSTQSYKTSDELLLQLWLMELETGEQASDLESYVQRLTQLSSYMFPKMKIDINTDLMSGISIDKVIFTQSLLLILFLIGKQSRDGNEVKIEFRLENDKDFQKILSFNLSFEKEVSFRIVDFDQEGKNFLKMLEINLSNLGWKSAKLDPKKLKTNFISYQIS